MENPFLQSLYDSPYRDQRLEPEEIRLLKISWHARLEALYLTTHPVALSDEPIYEALSYVWGTAPASKSVRCNGAHICVSPSTYEMLEHLRLLQPDIAVSWVEARESMLAWLI